MIFKKWLDDHDVMYSKAAKRIGITDIYLGRIINGKTYPSIDLARKIEDYTKGEIDWTQLVKPRKPKDTK